MKGEERWKEDKGKKREEGEVDRRKSWKEVGKKKASKGEKRSK